MTSKADRTVSQCAVSLYWLYDFVAKRQSDLNDLCTQDVVTQIIMSETQAANCRYVDLLPDSYVSSPTYFACHVWTAPFLDLVNSFRQYFNEELEECKGIYIWIDIFAINQNVPGNLSEDLKKLPTIIQAATKGTLICLDVDNTLLTRSWCLYEIWTAHCIASDRVKLIDNHQIDYAKLKDVFTQCDITTAEAAYLADQDNILKEIQDNHSVVKVNSSIRKTLVESARTESQENTIYQETNPRKMYKSHTKYGNFLGYIEEYDKALLLLERSLEMAEKAVGSLHNDVADVLHSVARIYSDMERHEDALPLYRRALGIYEKNLGGEHGKTVSAFNSLGSTLCKLEKFNEAIPLYKRSLRKKHLSIPGGNNRSKSF